MNTSITKSQGFTLVEMLIVVAIIGILSTIAYPSYIHYIERGYQSQAHTELLAINNALKTELVKNPTLKIKDEIEKLDGKILIDQFYDKVEPLIKINVTIPIEEEVICENIINR